MDIESAFNNNVLAISSVEALEAKDVDGGIFSWLNHLHGEVCEGY